MAQSAPNVVLVGVDIEKTGSFLIQNPTMSVGFYLTDLDGTELLKRKFNIRVQWPTQDSFGDFEPRCWTEFWSKQPDEIRDACLHKPEADAPEKVWLEIAAFIDSLEVHFPTSKVVFLSDNASFDVASIDYALEKYAKRAPMRYSTSGKYRSIKAADDMLDMLPVRARKQADQEIHARASHTHDCVEDAKFIVMQYVYAMKVGEC